VIKFGLDDVLAARERLKDIIVPTPLLPLRHHSADREIFLKLENLQPLGSFKIRGAMNAIRSIQPERIGGGVWTASAGNFGQGLAYAAQRLAVPMAAIVPSNAAESKIQRMRELGADVRVVPFEEWWSVLVTGSHPAMSGTFISPFADANVMAGNGTIALEILEQLPDIDAVLVPYGGGGLICGIGVTMRESKSNVQIIAAETEASPQVREALAAHEPVKIQRQASFIDGMGGNGVFPEMWPLVEKTVTRSVVVSVADVAACVRMLALDAKVIAEGAGAAPVAAALSGQLPEATKIVCIVSGGNIDAGVLAEIISTAPKTPRRDA
jgi:threonine dehydratase